MAALRVAEELLAGAGVVGSVADPNSAAPGRVTMRAYRSPASTLAGDANTPASRESPAGTVASGIGVVEASTVLTGGTESSVARICITQFPPGEPDLLISISPRTKLPVLWAGKF